MAATSDTDPLIRKLESIFPLTDVERDALATLPMQMADLRPSPPGPPQVDGAPGAMMPQTCTPFGGCYVTTSMVQ